MKMIRIVPFPDADVLSMEPFSSFTPVFDIIWFELQMVPALVGKDLGKGKGDGRGEERRHWWWKAEAAGGGSEGSWVGRRQKA